MRSFAQEDYEISRYSEKVDETLNLGLGQAVSCLIFPPLTRKEGRESVYVCEREMARG